MVTTDPCWMCCGSLRARLGCPVIPEVVTQALGRSLVLWEVPSVLDLSYNLYFFVSDVREEKEVFPSWLLELHFMVCFRPCAMTSSMAAGGNAP